MRVSLTPCGAQLEREMDALLGVTVTNARDIMGFERLGKTAWRLREALVRG